MFRYVYHIELVSRMSSINNINRIILHHACEQSPVLVTCSIWGSLMTTIISNNSIHTTTISTYTVNITILLMVQKSSDHQLRLVVNIPLFTVLPPSQRWLALGFLVAINSICRIPKTLRLQSNVPTCHCIRRHLRIPKANTRRVERCIAIWDVA